MRSFQNFFLGLGIGLPTLSAFQIHRAQFPLLQRVLFTGEEAFELFGFTIGESFLFLAEYDPFNLAAGFSFLNFDVNDISNSFAFQGFWDGAFGEGFMDIFSTDGEFLDAGTFSLSNATLVSEPATVFLMLGAIGGLLLRRRKA